MPKSERFGFRMFTVFQKYLKSNKLICYLYSDHEVHLVLLQLKSYVAYLATILALQATLNHLTDLRRQRHRCFPFLRQTQDQILTRFEHPSEFLEARALWHWAYRMSFLWQSLFRLNILPLISFLVFLIFFWLHCCNFFKLALILQFSFVIPW